MIGPSSSHTAGAARLARVAAVIAEKPFTKVVFGLSGSFAKTYKGHGTDKALLAGALGMAPDDERIPRAMELARQQGIAVEFVQEDIGWLHENAVHITFYFPDGQTSEVWGASIGGGRITINRIGDFETQFHAESPTLLINHTDLPGVISQVSQILAQNHINIAVLRLSRLARGKQANAVFVVDGGIPPAVIQEIRALDNVREVRVVDVS